MTNQSCREDIHSMVTDRILFSDASSIEDRVAAQLQADGLYSLGWFDLGGRPGLLIGNVGSSLWPAFSNSAYFTDGLPDPLDRWTREVVERAAAYLADHGLSEVHYPFGQPNWPFQDYARKAMGVGQSPIGLLIHPEYGLWTAYRAALIFDAGFAIPEPVVAPTPCDSCSEKPCLSICPVSAFTGDGYDYRACKNHIAQDSGRMCLESGCLARLACPVGREHAYQLDHQGFHMRAYV